MLRATESALKQHPNAEAVMQAMTQVWHLEAMLAEGQSERSQLRSALGAVVTMVDKETVCSFIHAFISNN